MKLILNLMRAAIFTVIILFTIPYLYYGFAWLGANALIYTGMLKKHLSPFVFWLLFFLIVIGTYRLVWSLFKGIATLIIMLANKICPYEGYASWVTIIFTLLSFLSFEYGYWSTNGWPSFSAGIIGAVLSFMAFSLLGAIFQGVRIAWGLNRDDY